VSGDKDRFVANLALLDKLLGARRRNPPLPALRTANETILYVLALGTSALQWSIYTTDPERRLTLREEIIALRGLVIVVGLSVRPSDQLVRLTNDCADRCCDPHNGACCNRMRCARHDLVFQFTLKTPVPIRPYVMSVMVPAL